MKKKELKEIAKKISTYEILLQKETNESRRKILENKIYDITSSITSWDEMFYVDELVVKILEKVPDLLKEERKNRKKEEN